MKKQGSLALILLVFLCSYGASSDSSPSAQITDAGLGLNIEKKINEWRASSRKVLAGEQIYSSVLVERFYKARKYQPAWSHNGHLTQVPTLVRAVEESYGDGLTPDYYHLDLIKSLTVKAEKDLVFDQARFADLDIILTDAFLTLSCHLSGGCANPAIKKTEWFARQRSVDVPAVLEQALREKQVKEALLKLRPEQGSYDRLRQALARYRALSLRGEWPSVLVGPALKKESVSERVAALRKRLFASGDLEAEAAKGGNFFDDRLEQAVIAFQQRHGLKADGIVGPATINSLNVPLKQRIRQIELNLERMRWIPDNIDQSSIVVNIADFGLEVLEKGKPVLSMKVVVGKPFQRTPVFTAKMTSLVVNPSWNVPASIARKELLKKIKNNPEYLAEQNIKVLGGSGSQNKELDPKTIDWSGISANTLAYRFRQVPGPLNPLGHLKFMLPNNYEVYLHDTPSKSLFSESVRTFSHGCIRIEKPLELAEYLMRGDPDWTREKLAAAISKGTEQTIMIPHPMDVHFLYLTAWVDEAGVLQFRNDVYKRDRQLDEAFRNKPSFH